MTRRKVLLFCLFFLITSEATRTRRRKIGAEKLQNVFSWKQIQFENGGFAGQNDTVFDVPMGFDVWNDKVFLGFPRRRVGVPSTVNYVSLSDDSKSPVVRPYPDRQSNDLNGPNPIVSVSRPRVDSCGRLWLMDTGVMTLKGVPNQVRPPKIVIIDLKTDKIIKTHELKNGRDYIHNDPSGLVSTTVDIPNGDCDNAFAYIPDLSHNSIVVYSLKAEDSWRVRHNFMHMTPEEGEFSLNGLQFQWDDGVFSIALGLEDEDGYRTVFFHAMASYSERAVSSEVLRNKTLATRGFHGTDFQTVGVRGPKSQINIHAVDQETGIMFFIQPHTSSLHCWDTSTAHVPRNMGAVAQDYELLFYPSDLKLDSEGNVWVLSNKFPVFLYSTMNPSQENIRLFKVPIKDAIRGTVC